MKYRLGSVTPAFLCLFIMGLVFVSARPCWAEQEMSAAERDAYESPYDVNLPWSNTELILDLLKGERGDPRMESSLPEAFWYARIHSWVGPWGPLARTYMPPLIAEGKSADWKRARLIATAMRYIGYHYRHHYIPDWNPPYGWYLPPEGEPRHDGKGLDCSNFTSFVYNQALGLGISSDIHKQAETEEVAIHGSDEEIEVEVIPRQETLKAWEKILKPGDLLFIRPRTGEGISHVVIWIGSWGVSQEQAPLILDSHGEDVRDSNGFKIPEGVYLRPFRAKSWYAGFASHAIRIIK